MKSNATIKINYTSQLDGLIAYGKKMKLPPVVPGDSGHAVELGVIMKDLNPGKTHHFYPTKWGYTWAFCVGESEFEFK